MTAQQRIDWINYIDEISHRLHQLMAIQTKLEESRIVLDIDLDEMDDALQATLDFLPEIP